ncbi:hypothetical protein KL86PLE_100596 [uncultured Pleomorphomonas sp.]|uniref:Uncharacterized protein n=1 Tax=uncultured Pleomorphomonas sp. TaxID=442121 RepID=A0A212L4M4_9HYPH|nr:hypothetical protein KL86PLE_100596 [uncultured Pleomorphomonas sp.]
MRHPPEIGHFARSADHRIDEADQRENQAGHPPHPHRPPVGDAGRRGDIGDRGGMPLEMEHLEGAEAIALPGQLHEGAGEIGHVGPGMRHIRRPRRPDDALPRPGGDEGGKPALAGNGRAEEVAGPQDNGANPTVARRLGKALLDVDADAALLRGRRKGNVRRQPVRHALAEAVDAAGEQMQRPEPLGDGQRRGAKRPRQLGPAVIGRVEAVEHHVNRRAGRLGDRFGIVEIGLHRPNPVRQLAGPSLAHQAGHLPAPAMEFLGNRLADATESAEDEDMTGHDKLLK